MSALNDEERAAVDVLSENGFLVADAAADRDALDRFFTCGQA